MVNIGIGLLAILCAMLGRAVAVYPCCALFALALSLPPQLPHREEIITVTFAVVAFSVFVQGLTITPLLHWIEGGFNKNTSI